MNVTLILGNGFDLNLGLPTPNQIYWSGERERCLSDWKSFKT